MILKKQQATKVNMVSSILFRHSVQKMVPIEQGMIPIAEELSISYIIVQHKKEMLDSTLSLKQVIKETLDKEFLKTLRGCLFVPLLHDDTPVNCVIPKSKQDQLKQMFLPDPDLLTRVQTARK